MKSRHLFVIIASCLIFMLSQGVAWANKNIDMLQKQAMDAFKDGNYKLAEELLKNALSIEESDVLWLNLGRTYMRQNRCVEARNAYAKVNLGKAMPIVVEKYGEYQKDLMRICSCEVEFLCTAPDVKIYVDNFDIGSACGESIHLTSGLHSFREENASGSLSRLMELQSDGVVKTVDFKAALAEQMAATHSIASTNQTATEPVVAMNQTATDPVASTDQTAASNQIAAVDHQQVEEVIPPPETEDPEVLAKKYSKMRIAGYTLLGIGAAGALASGIVLGVKYKDVEDENEKLENGGYMVNSAYVFDYFHSENNILQYNYYEHYKEMLISFNETQPVLIAGMAAGSVIAVTGLVLTVLGHVMDRPAESDETSGTAGLIEPVWSVSPTSVGGGMVIRF